MCARWGLSREIQAQREHEKSLKQACEGSTKGLEGGSEWGRRKARLSRWRQREEEDGQAGRGFACKETLESESKEFGVG